MQEQFDKAIAVPTTEDDTHPGPLDRFRMIAAVPMPVCDAVPGTVWDLFADRAAIENEMMAQVETNVKPHRE